MCRPKSTFICFDCKSQKIDETYAVDRSGPVYICDDCAHNRELQDIRNCSRYSVYGPAIVQRLAKITTWPGRELGTIVSCGHRAHPFTIRSIWGKKFHCTIKMVDGSMWSGWIGSSVLSNIKKVSN